MGHISEVRTFPPTFDVNLDFNELCNAIERARTNTAQRTIIFLGETHSLVCDVRRRNKVAIHFRGKTGLLIVVERAMETDAIVNISAKEFRYKKLAEFFTDQNAAVFERNIEESMLSSFDNMRNVEIVGSILKALNEATGPVNCVLIVFGQDHERYLMNEFQKQSGMGDHFRWWRFRSMDDEFDALPAVQYANHNGYRIIGFTEAPHKTDLELCKLLLTKGVWWKQFEIDVMAAFSSHSSGTGLYVVYGDAVQFGAKIDKMAFKGTAKKRIKVTGPAAVRLVKVTSEVQYKDLINTYNAENN